MPLEIQKLPVQRLHHRASGSSILGGLPYLLAVVLGLFAHSEALAQTAGSALIDLTLGGATVPDFDSSADTRTFTAEDVAFGVTEVTVAASPKSNWEVTYGGAADAIGVAALAFGPNTITVRATSTSTADPQETQRNYTIRVRRLAEEGSALSDLMLSAGQDTLDPPFDPAINDRTFTADVLLSVATLTVTAATKDGWEDPTYHDSPDADTSMPGYQRSLAVGANRITVRATPIGASGTRNHAITVTRTTTPGAPRSLRATAADRSVRLTWTAPSSDGGRDITGYEYRSKDADVDDGQWMDVDAWNAISGSDDSTTSHDLDSLTNGTTYIFQVRATNANTLETAKGSASNTAEATPARPLPAPIWTTDPPAVVEGNRRVTLSWIPIPDATTADNDDASVTGYQYRRRVDGGSYRGWTTIADGDLVKSDDTRSYTVTPLNNGTTYFFQVRGRNSVGGGAESTEREGTPEAKAPGAPTNLTATEGDEQVTLSWTAPADGGGELITGYEYRYREQTGDYPVDSNNVNVDVWTATGGTGRTVTVTVPGLMNGTTYLFQVRAVNDLGCGTCRRRDGGLRSGVPRSIRHAVRQARYARQPH